MLITFPGWIFESTLTFFPHKDAHKANSILGTTSGAGAAYLAFIPVFSRVRVAQSFVIWVVFCGSFFVSLSFFALAIVLSVLWFTASELTTLAVIGTDYIGSYKTNYHSNGHDGFSVDNDESNIFCRAQLNWRFIVRILLMTVQNCNPMCDNIHEKQPNDIQIFGTGIKPQFSFQFNWIKK